MREDEQTNTYRAENIHCYFCAVEIQRRELDAVFQKGGRQSFESVVIEMQSLCSNTYHLSTEV